MCPGGLPINQDPCKYKPEYILYYCRNVLHSAVRENKLNWFRTCTVCVALTEISRCLMNLLKTWLSTFISCFVFRNFASFAWVHHKLDRVTFQLPFATFGVLLPQSCAQFQLFRFSTPARSPKPLALYSLTVCSTFGMHEIFSRQIMSGWWGQRNGGVTAYQMWRKIANNFPTVIMLNMRSQFVPISATSSNFAAGTGGQAKNYS